MWGKTEGKLRGGFGGVAARADAPSVGKRTLVEQADAAAPPSSPVVQRRANGDAEAADAAPGATAVDIARAGVAGGGEPLPHRDRIQASFGRHDVSGVTARRGPAAREASHALGASAFAFGNSVAFAGAPDLPTAAHEAAHVVQHLPAR